MKKMFFVLFVLTSAVCRGQDCEFHVDRMILHADINYDLIRVIDTIDIEGLCDNIVLMDSNEYSIYLLSRKGKGISLNEDTIDVSELIIFKSYNDRILESYYIPLSWREPPLSNVILHSRKTIPTKAIIDINEIGLLPINPDGFSIVSFGKCILN